MRRARARKTSAWKTGVWMSVSVCMKMRMYMQIVSAPDLTHVCQFAIRYCQAFIPIWSFPYSACAIFVILLFLYILLEMKRATAIKANTRATCLTRSIPVDYNTAS